MKRIWRHFQFICTMLVIAGSIIVGLSINTKAATPGIINYQGRVQSGGADFNGSGAFKFALVNATGTITYWGNDGTSTAGSEPTAAVSINVAKGLYSVLLGDATITNMTVIPSTAFTNGDAKLRIWFNDGTNGSQLLTPDQKIAASGYAMQAAVVDDGSVTRAKLATRMVNGSSIGSFPKCRVFNSANQSILDNTNFTLNFDTVRYDTDNIHSAPGTRLTCNTPGVYRIFGNVEATGGAGVRDLSIKVNGTNTVALQRAIPTGGFSQIFAVSTDVQLQTGDYVELLLSIDLAGQTTSAVSSGGADQASCEFGMSYVP